MQHPMLPACAPEPCRFGFLVREISSMNPEYPLSRTGLVRQTVQIVTSHDLTLVVRDGMGGPR
mgnify:CR=1 FL=1